MLVSAHALRDFGDTSILKKYIRLKKKKKRSSQIREFPLNTRRALIEKGDSRLTTGAPDENPDSHEIPQETKTC